MFPPGLNPSPLAVGGNPAPTFNAAFSLTGEAVPLPASLLPFGSGLLGLVGLGRRFRKG